MRNKEAMNRVRAEVKQHTRSMQNTSVPELDGVSTTEAPATWQSMSSLKPSSLPYTTATFYETLRLYPPVPFELKQCSTSTTLPDGTFLPRTAILVWCTWAMNRSRTLWGADAEVFRPERWLQDGKFIGRPAHEFPVFNGGPRTCLGKNMAEQVAVQVIAVLVDQFTFAQVEDGERLSKNSLTLPMEGGLPCYVGRSKSRGTL